MRLLACALFWAGAAMLLSALVGGAAASASAAYWAQPLPSDEYIPLDVIYDESAFSPAHADELSELSADETVFLELEPGADAESAFLSVDEAEELTRGLPVDSGHSIYTESRKVGKPADLPDRGVWKKVRFRVHSLACTLPCSEHISFTRSSVFLLTHMHVDWKAGRPARAPESAALARPHARPGARQHRRAKERPLRGLPQGGQPANEGQRDVGAVPSPLRCQSRLYGTPF
jgi:hypothetical protein